MAIEKFIETNQPFGAVDFEAFKTVDFLPSVKEGIELAKKNIKDIKKTSQPNFSNTFEPFDFTTKALGEVTSVFYNLLSAETNEELQKVAKDIAPLLSDFNNDVVLDSALYEKFKEVNLEDENLTTEQSILVEKTMRRFERNGANLGDEEKETLRDIDRKLSQLKLTFSDNALAETNTYILKVADFDRIKDLPENVLEAAQEKAEQLGNKDAWVFTLQFPSYVPFMTYCADRVLRKEMAIAFGSRCCKEGEHDNRKIIAEIAALRQQRAQLLGYENHAAYVLEERMAKDQDTVLNFLNDLLDSALLSGENDIDELSNLAKELDGIEVLERHDIAYYAEKLKKRQLDIDDEALKPYFELEQTLDGLLGIANEL